MDSPWVAIGVIGAIAIVVAGLMIGITLLSAGPEPVRYRFTSRDMELEYPDGWTQARGVAGQPAAHRIIVHLVSYYLPPAEMCTAFGEPCSPAPEEIPNGESSVTIIAYEGGTPPEPEPLISRPFGLDADAMIGGQAAAMDRRPAGDGRTLVWWQLSPPGFPDQWIEVNAIVADRNLEESGVLAEVEEILETLEFRGD